ncbi:MAG: hypothetical protein KDD01_00965 [Phaeodactylibacter sp.]|nr:hypothetical protein [Phaeodactylibacter sp.]
MATHNKILQGTRVKLTLTANRDSCIVKAISQNPRHLFAHYSDDIPQLIRDLEDLCDKYIEEMEYNVHTAFTQSNSSLRGEEIWITREYSL